MRAVTTTRRRKPATPPTHGGVRPGAGRKPSTGRGAATRTLVSVPFAADEIDALDEVRGDQPRATLLRELALREIAARRRPR